MICARVFNSDSVNVLALIILRCEGPACALKMLSGIRALYPPGALHKRGHQKCLQTLLHALAVAKSLPAGNHRPKHNIFNIIRYLLLVLQTIKCFLLCLGVVILSLPD